MSSRGEDRWQVDGAVEASGSAESTRPVQEQSGLQRHIIRFSADFILEADPGTVFPYETAEQRRVWSAVFRDPAVFRRIAALMLVYRLTGDMDEWFEDELIQADYGDLLNTVDHELSEDDRKYWKELREKVHTDQSDTLGDAVHPLFEAFRFSLDSLQAEDVASGEVFSVRRNSKSSGNRPTIIPFEARMR